MNNPLEIHPVGKAPCTVCEPDWLIKLSADVRMRQYWDGLPRINMASGQAWCSGVESDAVFWVETGLLATVFADAQGRERVHQFHPATHWLALPLGLPAQAWRIEAQIPSRLLVLNARQLEEAKGLDKRVHDWMLQALMAERLRLIQREHQWLMFSAAERYLKVLQEAPSWLDQVPQHRLASYLGVTDVALSRIRRRLKIGH
jgi:CRP-like cAMP-binding protein